MKGLLLIYVITALTTVGALRYPRLGVYVYVGFAVLRPQYIWGWAGDMSGLSFAVGVAMLVGWVFNGLGSWRFGRARPIIASLCAFFAWYLLSAWFAFNTDRSFDAVLNRAREIVPFLVGFTLLKSEKDWRPLMWTIVLAQGYVGAEMNWNYLHGYNSAAEGFAGMDNNFFAVGHLSVLGLAIAVAVASTTWWGRLLAAASAALILHTILLTFSRGAMLGLLAMGAAAVVIMPKRPKYLVALLVTVLLAIRLTGPELAKRYATTFADATERDPSAESRIELWIDCLKVVQSNPWFGVGPENWSVVAASYGWPEGKSAHSVWMETAAEVGVPGVLALVSFFAWTLVRLWPVTRARPTEENRYEIAVANGIVLSIVGFAVAGQFVSITGCEVQYYIVMLGAVMLRGNVREAVAPARIASRRLSYPPYRSPFRPLGPRQALSPKD